MTASKKISAVWDDLLDVKYISPQPGIRQRIKFPESARADNDVRLNNQPWYHGSNFGKLDPSKTLIPEFQKRSVKKS